MQSRFFFLSAAIACLSFISCSSTTNPPAPATYHIIPRSEVLPYGQTWGAWAVQWMQWSISMPADHHPLFDTAPVKSGQTQPVWFLGGLYQLTDSAIRSEPTRTAVVPFGTTLLVACASACWDTVGGEPTLDSLAIVTRSAWNAHTPIGTLEIDGVTIPNIQEFLVDTTRCILDYPDSNVSGYTPGKVASCAMGYYIMIDGLSKGQHTVLLRGGNASVQANVYYQLSVQ